MDFNLIEVTAPTEEPITSTEFKTHARISSSAEDTFIDGYIKSCRFLIEEYCRISFVQTTWKVLFDTWPGVEFNLPRSPLISIDSVKYLNASGVETTLSSSAYQTDLLSRPGRVALAFGYTWPVLQAGTINGVRVQFKAGYGDDADDVPEGLKMALKFFVSHVYETREPAEERGIPGFIKTLLHPYRA